jgi:dihydrofolate synthase / folylpolyglutamate synthase
VSEHEADLRLRAVAAAYPRHRRRSSLAQVRALRSLAGIDGPPARIAVVGTNGKSSTATYVARMFGPAAGCTISPHLVAWSERVVLGGKPVDSDALAADVQELHELAGGLEERDQLRFYDLLTLAAAQAMERAGSTIGVFEAGIGGRLDAVAALDPQLSVLVTASLDHADLLGESVPEILREKIGVATRGTTLVSGVTGPDVERAAAEIGVELVRVDLTGGRVVERNLSLARAVYAVAVDRLGLDVPAEPPAIDAAVSGRRERRTIDGVEVLLDGAHNPEAWEALLAELAGQRFVALVAAPGDRNPSALLALEAEAVVVTDPWPGRTQPVEQLAATLVSLDPAAVADPTEAFAYALACARRRGCGLAVLGSLHLLRHVND